MKLEVGKYYRTREGKIVGPIEKSPINGRFPFRVFGHNTYTKWGNCFSAGDSRHDLIEEVPSPQPLEDRIADLEKEVAELKQKGNPTPKGGDPNERIEMNVTMTRRQAQMCQDVLVRTFFHDVTGGIMYNALSEKGIKASNSSMLIDSGDLSSKYKSALDKEMGWDK
jgi:hypothetical protein